MTTGSWPARVITTSSRSSTTALRVSAYFARDSEYVMVRTANLLLRTGNCTSKMEGWQQAVHVASGARSTEVQPIRCPVWAVRAPTTEWARRLPDVVGAV